MNVGKLLLLLFLLALLAAGIAYWRMTATPFSQDDGVAEAPSPANTEGAAREVNGQEIARPEAEEDKTRRKLLGVWQYEYQEKRTMTLNKDGRGTMLVELPFGSRLRFDMKWSLNGKKLTKKTVGGEPAVTVNFIVNWKGNTAEESILEITDDRLLLLDLLDKKDTRYDWKRVKKDESDK